VPAGRIREHLEWLRTGGVGLRRVAEVSGVSRSALTDIAAGRQRRLRPTTGERIMAVSRRDGAAGALVDGAGTWELLERLLAAGCSRTWIARQLGSQAATPALQLRRERVLRSTAIAVEQLARCHGLDVSRSARRAS